MQEACSRVRKYYKVRKKQCGFMYNTVEDVQVT